MIKVNITNYTFFRKNYKTAGGILDTKQANFLSSSSDLYQIKSFVQKIGTNPLVRDKSAHFAAPVPSQFVAERRALLPTPPPPSRASSPLSASEVSFCGGGG